MSRPEAAGLEELPRIAISTGDPGGIGPEIAVRAAASLADRGACLLYGDAASLEALCRRWAPARPMLRFDAERASSPLPRGALGLIDTGATEEGADRVHAPTEAGGRAQLRALDAAIAAVRAGSADAICTAPTSKEAISASGTPFVGQTEHLARAFGLPDEAVTMLFLGPRLKVSLVTRHLALREVPEAVTPSGVAQSAAHLAEALVRLGIRAPGGAPPRLVVAGLNPHAGEGGLFGDEEPRLLEPGVAAARAAAPFSTGEAALLGIWPAETAFRRAAEGAVEGVVAIFHDQATIASKILDWGEAVNVSWGLPIVRTSVDHGVAYEAAARGQADPRGMVSALELAIALAASRGPGRAR